RLPPDLHAGGPRIAARAGGARRGGGDGQRVHARPDVARRRRMARGGALRGRRRTARPGHLTARPAQRGHGLRPSGPAPTVEAMAPPISDAAAVDVFRKVDRLLALPVSPLRRPPSKPPRARDRWGADQVPVVPAVVSAAPRFLGKLADLLPLQNTVGTAMQSLVVLG